MSSALEQGLLEPGACGTNLNSGKGTRCPVAEFSLPKKFRKHPGGQEHLKTAGTSDCAGLMFLLYHMGLDLDGHIEETTNSYGLQAPERGPLFTEVHDMVRRVREEHGIQRRIFQVWCLLITALLPLCFVWSLVTAGFLSSVATALLFELYFLNVFHTRHHKGGSLYGSTTLNALLNPAYNLIDSTWGYHPPAWRLNHHIKHHMHTNDDAVDPDLPATYPLIRLFQAQERLWFHKFQTLYWPLLLPFSVARFPFSNLLEHGGHPAYFAVWMTLMFILPVGMHGSAGLIWSLVLQGLTGVSITYKFAISHAHAEHAAKESEPKKDVREMSADECITEQIMESTSWGGYWSTLIFGGINMQIEHHIAPALEPPLLACIAPELRRICGKHNIPYIAEPTLFHALAKFHLRLWMSG